MVFLLRKWTWDCAGPGQVLGTRQSGLPDFALASLVEDQEVLELARTAAQMVIENDESLNQWAGGAGWIGAEISADDEWVDFWFS